MIRLFLQHGAGPLDDQLCRFALLRRDPSVLRVFEEFGFGNGVTRSALFSMSSEVTGNPPAVSIRNCGVL